MIPVHEITKSLPPTRDDEPPSLRQDIVDEILDHLLCGLRRELLIHDGDETLSRQRVLNRLGDPGQMARKLWFQAMWSKIMTQRLVVGSAIFSMVVSAILVAMVGWMMQQQQRVNAAMLEQMAKLTAQRSEASTQRDLRWNNLKAKLTIGAQDGPAAEGCQINVIRKPGIGEDAKNGADFSAKTDSSGEVDCGFVEPGVYELTATTPWNEKTEVRFIVFPGQDHVERLVVPERKTEMTDVSFEVEALQKGLKGTELALVIDFVPTGTRDIAGQTWRVRSWAQGTSRPLLLFVPRHGAWIAKVEDGRWIERMTAENAYYGETLPYLRNETWEKLDSSTQFRVPTNRYQIQFDILKVTENPKRSNSSWQVDPASDFGLSEPESWSSGWHPNYSELIAEPGKLNHWAVSIPDELKRLRELTKKMNEPSSARWIQQ